MSSLSDVIYAEVLRFCERSGLIDQLKQSLAVPERERFNQLNISEDGLGVLDAVHCVYDKKRSLILLNELERLEAGKVAIEAGIGTGILSFLLAAKGIEVHGIELNPEVLDLASNIKEYLASKKIIREENIHFLLGDATTFVLSFTADILVSENLYTGMFYEKQVPIMNHLLAYLGPRGTCVPSGLRSYLSLAETLFPHTPGVSELFVPGNEGGFEMTSKNLSEAMEYDSIDFTRTVSGKVDRVATLIATSAGNINSLLIGSEVLLPSGKVIGREDTVFLNNDIYLALERPVRVKAGDRVSVQVCYDYGSRPDQGLFQVTRL